MRHLSLVGMALLVGCGGNAVQGTTSDAGLDAPRPDVVADDAPVSTDGVVQGDAAPDITVDAVARDVPSTTDAPRPLDAPAGPSLLGRWRVTRWEYTAADGHTVVLTDTNTEIDVGMGATAPFRVNGMMNLTPARADVSFGTVGNEHFYVFPMPMTPTADYSATGFSLVGLWSDVTDTFTLPGRAYTLHLTRNADGTISLGSMEGGEGSVTTFTRAADVRGPSSFNEFGAAQLRQPDASLPFAHARFSLLWENPAGASAAPIETNRSALTFRMGYAGFPVVFASGPAAEVIGRVDGVQVAVAIPFVYDDLNDNGRYDPSVGDAGGGDDSRGFGPLVIVWRGEGTPGSQWAESAFASVVPGWQVAHVSRINGEGDLVLQPYDPSVQPSPDVPVSPTALRGPAPRFMR